MARSTDIKFTCSVCGTLTRATIATGQLHRHTPAGRTERCKGSRKLVFEPGKPDNRLDDTPTPIDFDWFAKKPIRIRPNNLVPADIKTAHRLLRAAKANPKKYGNMREPLNLFLDYARAHRPDLFTGQPTMRPNQRGPAPIAAAADPGKTLGRARTVPTRKVWYREVLVGKRN